MSSIARSRPCCTAWCSITRLASFPTRDQHWSRTAALHQRRVRRLPRVRHPGAWLPEVAMWRVRPRQAAGIQLQAARLLPLMRRSAYITDRGAPGGPRHSTYPVAAQGAVAADPAARAAGCATRADHAGAPAGAARAHAAPSGPSHEHAADLLGSIGSNGASCALRLALSGRCFAYGDDKERR